MNTASSAPTGIDVAGTFVPGVAFVGSVLLHLAATSLLSAGQGAEQGAGPSRPALLTPAHPHPLHVRWISQANVPSPVPQPPPAVAAQPPRPSPRPTAVEPATVTVSPPPLSASPAPVATAASAPAAPSSPDPAAYLLASSLSNPAQPLVDIEPVYPPAAEQQQGRVVLRLLINEAGGVDDVSVLQAHPPQLFEHEAIAAFSKAIFSPAMQEGRPVKSQWSVEVEFTPFNRGSVSGQSY